jgi:hypothetical protein
VQVGDHAVVDEACLILAGLDAESEEWLLGLTAAGARPEAALARLHELLRGAWEILWP